VAFTVAGSVECTQHSAWCHYLSWPNGRLRFVATSRRYTAPASWLTTRGQWPGGPFKADTPPYALKTAQVVERLEAAMLEDGRSARQVALAAEIDPGTLSRLRSGHAVPDLATLDALERTLGTNLWIDRARN
jgi:hypothetical protein